MTRSVTFTKAQVRRAVQAAESAGKRVQSITIGPDGAISVDGPPRYPPERFFDLEKAAAYCRSNPDQFRTLIEIGIFPARASKTLWDRQTLDLALIAATPKVRPGGGRIYFLAIDSFIKIGFSVGVCTRIEQMQTGSPFEIILLADVPGTMEGEQAMHAKFRHLHERGEWFRRAPGLLAYIDWLQGK